MKYLVVKCVEDHCPNFGQVINRVEFDDGPEQATRMELMLENWGQGSEDNEDCCTKCGSLGELVDPEEEEEK